jgi:hypothetical protein
MIYLIDDNQKRQRDSGWGDKKFEQYKEFIHPIYRLSEVTDDLRNGLFRNENNVILFHESFFENYENKQANDVNDIRNKLEKLSNENSTRYYVIFSGSNSERKLNVNNTSASIPVHILYNNLEIFIKQFQSRNEYNLEYLLYGANPDIEAFLLEELNKSNRVFIEDTLELTNEVNDYFFFRSKLDVNPISEYHTTIFNKDSEFGFHKIISNSLSKIEYKGIFVPLCFGNSLSDFNGLRLASEIRCTNNINQCTPIFIYSFVRMEYLLQNEYFNILRTKGVELMDYSKKAFQFAASRRSNHLKHHELPKEIIKLELQPPKNYLDNHSIANEWAIHQWAKTIGCDETDELTKIFKNVEANLYFKYLRTINPISELNRISAEKLKFKYEGTPKVCLIDDEADKGWYEIFAYLLGDINGIYTDYLGVDFKNLDTNDIIEKSFDKIVTDKIDVVILDFRLNPSDLENKNLEDITSIKLLKKFKNYNPGIQVIIVSATTKIWNLQALQEAGADGFVIKESPENSIDINFTAQTIGSFKYTLENCLRKCFLKEIFSLMGPVAKLVKIESQKKSSKFSLSIQQNIIQNINQRIEIFNQLIYNFPSNLEWSFSTLILIIEEIVNAIYIDDGLDHVVEVNIFNKVKCNYTTSLGRFLSIKPNHNNSNYTKEEYAVPDKDITYYSKTANRDPFNFRLTCILHYKYEIPLGVEIFQYFPLYTLRSTSVMHVGKNEVGLSDLKLGIKLLKEIIK